MTTPTSAAEPSAATEADALVGQLVAGRYRVEQLLGAGGMGAVYRAEHTQLRKSVALKVLHRSMLTNEEAVARFEREGIAAARIEHSNVASATDFGRLEDGAFFLVMEYVDGRSLAGALREGPLAPDRAVRIGRQVLEALEAAHSLDIVHRDLKPDNIMLVEREGSERVKVLDFGIAKVRFADAPSGQLTQLGTVFGTPEYMCPEQAMGQAVDHRADLYAFGIILYEMLAGQVPFQADDLMVLLTKQMTEVPPMLPQSVPTDLQSLVARLLAKEPADRPQSAAAVRAELDAFGTTPVPAPVESTEPVASAPTLLAISAASVPQPTQASGLRRPVVIAGTQVPLAAVIAGCVSLFSLPLIIVVAILATRSDDAATSEGPTQEESSLSLPDIPFVPPSLDSLAERAEQGDEEALEKLEASDEKDRSAKVWVVLAKVRSARGQGVAFLEALEQAIRKDAKVASRPDVVADVRRAAAKDALANRALQLAAHHMGAAGADIVYDVWKASKPGGARTRAEALKKSPKVRESASPALAVALDLEGARKCGTFKELLPRAAEVGDERAAKTLARLTHRRGCGFMGLGDCYKCLRATRELNDALKAAKARSAPKFDLGS